MKALLCMLLMFPLSLLAIEIEGTYTVTGWDPYENHAYSGMSEIKKGKNNVYQMTYNFNDGTQYKGTLLTSGGNEASAVFQDANGSHTGLQIYKISETGLEGSWVLLNQSLVGNEKLTRQEQE